MLTEHIQNQLKNIIRLFYPNAEIKTTMLDRVVVFETEGRKIKCDYFVKNICADMYKYLCKITGKSMPWGSLTGIRPTRLVYKEMLLLQEAERRNNQETANIPVTECLAASLVKVKEKYFVSNKKIKLLKEVIAAQRGYITGGEKLVNYYVNIPICPSRCNYCSFPSAMIEKCKDIFDDYVMQLCEEIKRDGERLRNGGYKIYSIYIGGGTPTVLNEAQLEKVLRAIVRASCCEGYVPVTKHLLAKSIEFTCEAGRPDTITAQKLDLLKKYGVTRICINPQSFNNATLKAIGRNHTTEDFLNVYHLAGQYNFIINTDLIAGIAGESVNDFEYSLEKVIELSPHNITVHTLSNKRGSLSACSAAEPSFNCNVTAMVNLAYQKLTAAGYIPYYLYRQKAQKGALENVGYCKPSFQCLNNISVMEEMVSVLASGAGAISKKICTGDNCDIIRYANCKEIDMYITEFEARYKAKSDLFFD